MVAGESGGYAFKRIIFSLVRDGTRLKSVIEGHDEGCFSTISGYVREVLDGKRQSCYGVWLPDRRGS
jgi:hypothetical protein